MPTDEQVQAESSTAQTQGSPAMESWSDADRSEWLKTGNTPKPTEASAATEKKPSEPAKAEGDPKSDTGNDKGNPKRKNGEDRKAELGREIDDLLEKRRKLRGEVDEIEKGGNKPESPTGKTETPKAEDKPGERPKRPKYEDFQTSDEYETAMDKYQEDLTDWKLTERDRAAKAEESKKSAEAKAHEVIDGYNKRVDNAKPKYSDWDQVFAGASELVPTPAMEAAIIESEVGPELAYTLAKDPEEFARIAALSPASQAREIGKLEAKLSGETPAKAEPVRDEKTGQFSATKETPKPQHTRASKPPTELSGKGTAPEDEVAAAVKRDDFTAYRSAMNARERKK